jgi:hypothetical protein
VVDGVEEEAPHEVLDRGFPGRGVAHQEPARLRPAGLVEPIELLVDGGGVLLVRGDDVLDSRGRRLVLPLHHALLEEVHERSLLGGEHPGELGRRPGLRVGPVVPPVLGHGLQHVHELGELLLSLLAAVLEAGHGSSPLFKESVRNGWVTFVRLSESRQRKGESQAPEEGLEKGG